MQSQENHEESMNQAAPKSRELNNLRSANRLGLTESEVTGSRRSAPTLQVIRTQYEGIVEEMEDQFRELEEYTTPELPDRSIRCSHRMQT